MGKVSGENERLVAGFTDGVAEAVIVTVETDKDSPCFDMSAKVFARHHIRSGARQELAVDIDLQMMRVRAVEPIHEKRHPGRAAFEKADAQLWEPVKNSVRQHSGR